MFSFYHLHARDEHRLSLGMLMHVKCIHELCSLLPHICIILVVITNVLNDFGDFLNNPLSSGFNSVLQKRPSFSIFEFTGATGLGIEQTQSPCFRNFETDNMESLKEAKGAGKRKIEGLAHPPPLGAPPGLFSAFRSPFRFNFSATDSS